MGLREIVLLLIVVVAAYVGYQFYRIVRGKGGAKLPARAAQADTASPEDMADLDEDEDDDVLVFERPVVRPADDAGAPVVPDPKLFELELELRQLRRELELQRSDTAALRQMVDELGRTVHALRTPAAAPLTPPVRQGSPEYDEALVYARRGLDVEAIAERCGITVAEAELVRSLARGRPGERGGGQ